MKTAAVIFSLLLPAAAFSPVLSRIDPPGGQIGTEVEVTFHGERLDETQGALFYEPGLSLSGIRITDAKRVDAKITVAADASPGEHSLRLTGPGGITEVRSFWVGAFPVVQETEPNGSTGPGQNVEFNRTVHGIAGNEDEDCFIVAVKKGQRLSAEVEAMRLGRTMFDASLAIQDARGFELATCDDAPLLKTDAFVSVLAPEDGNYRVIVREAAYEGNDQCHYRLHIGGFPRPKAVFPTGGKPGETLEFTFTGDPAGVIKQSFTLPAEARADHSLYPVQDGLAAPSPHWISVSPMESARDGEGTHSHQSPAVLPAFPCAAQGVTETDRPSDWFKFTATKNQALVFRAIARSHRSPLDPVVSVHGTDGKFIAANDDQGAPDSILNWTCPADGDYLMQIRDQLRRTGPDFTYRIEITGKSPSLSASLPTVERVNTQKWKTFCVPRGNRYAAVVNITRDNTGCETVFEAASLPAGITMQAAKGPRNVTNFPVVFEAAPDAAPSPGLHAFRIRSEGEPQPLTGNLMDTIHHVDINNEGAYHSATYDRIAMAVIQEAPFKIDLESPSVSVVKNGTLHLKIRVARQPEFKEKVSARFLWNPPGVSGPVTVDIPGDQSEATYELNASADAATGEWQVCVLAEANTPKGPVLVSSALVPLKVADPYVSMTLDLAAAELGKAAAMLGKIETTRPYTGTATAQLTGLPHGVSCPPQPIQSGQTEVTFPLQISPEAKTGKHSGLFCVVQVPENGASVLHQTAMGGTLRIDAPPKGEAEKPSQPPATAAAAAPAPAKPLSRLEQLRMNKK